MVFDAYLATMTDRLCEGKGSEEGKGGGFWGAWRNAAIVFRLTKFWQAQTELDCKKLQRLSERLASLGIMGTHLSVTLIPPGTIVL